jgi:putative nucleotidyltransferase with HDIG domain
MLDTTPCSGTPTSATAQPPLQVLFVDDEICVLQGLERMLHGLRQQWTMRFALSGPAALAKLDEQPAEVVVSDLRMPGMCGGELLAAVARRWPETIRFILSGQADQGMVLRTIGPAHQFLQKPCDAEVLKVAIQTAWRLRCSLSNQRLRLLVGGMPGLSCQPGVLDAFLLQLGQSQPAIAALGALAVQDLGLSARLLQLVNSSFFGSRRMVANPAEAAQLLGIDRLRAMAAVQGVFAPLACPSTAWFEPERVWRHSVQVARLARRVAEDLGLPPVQVEEAATAGLLHDAGHLLLAAHHPHEYAALARQVRDEGDVLHERRLLGASHGEIAAYLLGLWGLPPAVVEAVAWHHEPRRGNRPCPGPLACVHAADALVNLLAGTPDHNRIDAPYLSSIGCGDRQDRWLGLAG